MEQQTPLFPIAAALNRHEKISNCRALTKCVNFTDGQSGTQKESVCAESGKPHFQEEVCLNDCLDLEFLSCSWEQRTLTLLFRTKPWMLNSGGNMHGGMIATVCDLTMGLLACYVKGSFSCVTVHLGMEYLRGISSESDVIVEARVEKAGRNLLFMSAKVYRLPDREVASIASAEFM